MQKKPELLIPNIITVTTNTAIDWMLSIKNFKIGTDHQVEQGSSFAAGKGVNVARTIAALAYPVSAFGFVGIESLDIFNAIRHEGVAANFISVPGSSRTNLTVCDVAQNQQTHIRTTGFCVSRVECEELLLALENTLNKGDLLILSGSLPEGASEHYYAEIIALAHQRQCCVFLDSSGLALRAGCNARPYLIKPNLDEFVELTACDKYSVNSIIDAARALIANGIEWVYVSRGESGLIVVNAQLAFSANCDCSVFGTASNYVGCGDAMVAGLAIARMQKLSIAETITLAMSCSVANMYSYQPGLIDPLLVSDIKKHIILRAVTAADF